MKAYVEFEISEGAYEISCPDAQCPEQGAMTLPEIAILTTTNLMKKHHRYRLNRGELASPSIRPCTADLNMENKNKSNHCINILLFFV